MESAELSSETMNHATYSEVTTIFQVPIELRDKVVLRGKIWFPGTEIPRSLAIFPSKTCQVPSEWPTNTRDSYGVIFEFTPYHANNIFISYERDVKRYTWFASRGFVGVRVDMRGSGDSEGLYYGEYLKKEQKDCVDVINWIKSQPWSNGKVGMFGKSWAGFNSLQVEFSFPGTLVCAVSAYATDNRFEHDIHCLGGCRLAQGCLSWASAMFAYNFIPPTHNVSNHEDLWFGRLRAYNCWLSDWLKHQTNDEFYKHGSICEDYSRVKMPVLQIAGLNDIYVTAQFRMSEKLPDVQTIIGPWAHNWPCYGTPGPFLSDSLIYERFFAYHLHNEGDQVLELPKTSIFVRDGPFTDSFLENNSGFWINLSKQKDEIFSQRWYLSENESLTKEPHSSKQETTINKNLPTSFFEILAFSSEQVSKPETFTYDKETDPICFSTEIEFEDDLVLIGQADLTLEIIKVVPATSQNGFQLFIKLYDIWKEEGVQKRYLVTYGVSNSYAIKGSDIVTVKLNATSYVFQKDHKMLIEASTSCFPIIWTPLSRSFPEFRISTKSFVLSLPVLEVSVEHLRNDANTLPGEIFQVSEVPKSDWIGIQPVRQIHRQPAMIVTHEFDFDTKVHQFKKVDDAGKITVEESGITLDELTEEIYTVNPDDPLSATGQVKTRIEVTYLENNNKCLSIETTVNLSCNMSNFIINSVIKAFEDEQLVFEKDRMETICRFFQ